MDGLTQLAAETPGINKFQEFLRRRWGEGCHNATKLWHEIQGQGYYRRTSTMAKPRQAAKLLARRAEKLKPDEE